MGLFQYIFGHHFFCGTSLSDFRPEDSVEAFLVGFRFTRRPSAEIFHIVFMPVKGNPHRRDSSEILTEIGGKPNATKSPQMLFRCNTTDPRFFWYNSALLVKTQCSTRTLREGGGCSKNHTSFFFTRTLARGLGLKLSQIFGHFGASKFGWF